MLFCALTLRRTKVARNEPFTWSARVTHRVLKVARTIADIHEHEQITEQDFLQAVACRPER
ncbi:MAG: hypothetical protein Q4G54_06135 [Pelistega sp.]|nr:hypothetical protein [Pelistega sp.]